MSLETTDEVMAWPDEASEWDQARAVDLLGTSVIVTLHYADGEGDEIGADQFTGLVTEVDEHDGITVETFQPAQGESVVLAPILDAFEPAQPGFYELDSGLTIDDPDWTVDLAVVITRPRDQLGLDALH